VPAGIPVDYAAGKIESFKPIGAIRPAAKISESLQFPLEYIGAIQRPHDPEKNREIGSDRTIHWDQTRFLHGDSKSLFQTPLP